MFSWPSWSLELLFIEITKLIQLLFIGGAGPGLIVAFTASSIFPFCLRGQTVSVGLPIGGNLLATNGVDFGRAFEATAPIAIGHGIKPRDVDDGAGAAAPALVVRFIAIGILTKGVVFVEGDFVAAEVEAAEGDGVDGFFVVMSPFSLPIWKVPPWTKIMPSGGGLAGVRRVRVLSERLVEGEVGWRIGLFQ